MLRRILPYLVPAAFTAMASFASCSSVQNSQIGISAPPYSQASFSVVGDYLENRCGTLDCHGQTGRNLRIWGCEGMRLAPDADPTSCENPTTEEEYEATYRSLVALEPQVMSSVWAGCAPYGADGGDVYPPGTSCHPELLTFIRKARGTEAHKGGQLICVLAPCPAGLPPQVPLDGDAGPLVDPQDVCLVSWLEGATDLHECGLAFSDPSFPLVDAGSE
ncbi:MAG TPA: hypothetical protein VGL81_01395 [Polyangiaceae bacterium]|jgi:hypothetical protein